MEKNLLCFCKCLSVFLLIWIGSFSGFAQTSALITYKKNDATLLEVFKEINKQTGLTVFYSNSLLNDKEKVKAVFDKSTLSDVLTQVLKNKNLEWAFQDQYIILKKKVVSTKNPQPEQNLQGYVTDEENKPLQGVSVKLQGTEKSAITNSAGAFAMNVTELKGRLVFSSVGFTGQEVDIDGRARILVTMNASTSGLNEVVVIGYGTTKRRDLTGAVGKANVEDMQKAPVTSFDQALAGRIAGVNVSSNDGQPGAASQIVVRGSSVTQDSSPLYVIDGFPIENMDVNSLNLNDVESMEVLKDASSIAIYGARGANGVILITTKRGKPGPARVTYTYNGGIQQDVKRVKMMDPYEFVRLQLELDSMRSTPANKVNTNSLIYLDPAKGVTLDSYKTMPGYDWQDLLLQNGSIQNHSINASGGTADTRYMISGSALDQKGIILNTGLKRYDGKLSLDQRFNKNFRAGISANYSNSASYGTIPAAGNGGGVVMGMWKYRPVSGLGNQDLLNSLIDSTAFEDFNNGNSTASLGDNLVNPLLQAENEYRKNINNTGTLNLFLEYSFLKKFKLRVSGGYNSTNLKAETFYNSKTQQGNLFTNSAGAIANTNGINASVNNQLNSNYLNEDILSFNSTIGKHQSINALIGFTYQYAGNYGNGFRVNQIPQATEYLGMQSLSTGTAYSPSTAGSRWQLFSYLSRVNYTLYDRYLFTGTVRADGSSKFAPGKQWGYFPSGAFAWRFSQEPAFKGISSVLSDGKIRVSYGSVGNNRVGDFSYLSQFGGLAGQFGYPTNNVYSKGVVPFFYGNSSLTWETSTQLDIGLNLSFFGDRVSFEADYYNKKTKNFLLLVRIPSIAGYAPSDNSQYQNTGSLRNRGLELTLNTVNISGRKFRWTSNFNISFNQGKILEFYNGFEIKQTSLGLPGGGNSATAWIATVGGPISQFYGYKWNGVYQYTDFNKLANGTYALKNGVPGYTNVQPGDPKYKDINGDGIVNANDQTVLGSPLPKHTGGFSNNFSYNKFTLNLFMQWSYGNQILNANRIMFESTGGFFLNGNQLASYANRWTPQNPSNDIQRAVYNFKGDGINNAVSKVSSRVIEDGSFLRLKTISLGYELPANIIGKVGMKSMRVFAAAQNILTFTKYSGIDPEVSTFRVQNSANSPGGVSGSTVSSGTGNTFIQPSSSYSALSGGLDFTPYPRMFTLSFGASATF